MMLQVAQDSSLTTFKQIFNKLVQVWRQKINFEFSNGPRSNHETLKIDNNNKIRGATINIRGLNALGKRQEIEKWATKQKLGFVCLQETKINHCGQEKRGKWNCFFSSSVDSSIRQKHERNKLNNKKSPLNLFKQTVEKLGVGIMVHDDLMPFVLKVESRSNRLMFLKLKGKAKINIISAYAPQADLPQAHKTAFYRDFNLLINSFPKHEITLAPGDYNARLYVLYEHERSIAGNSILKHSQGRLPLAQKTRENREFFYQRLF